MAGDPGQLFSGSLPFVRNTSKDKTLGGTTSYYTHSATPAIGMHLYNENDIDTGYIISTVNQNNSIEVSTPPAAYVVSFYRGSNINSFTVDGTTYTTYDNHILLTEGTHTLSIVYTSQGAGYALVGNSYLLSSSTSCSFTVNSTTVNFNNGTKTFSIGTTVVINWAISK